MPQITISDATELFGRLDGRAKSTMLIHRQLRNYYAKGLIEGERGETETAPVTLPMREVCKARLLNVLSDLGAEAKMLGHFVRAMETPPHRVTPIAGKVHPASGLDQAIAGIAAGEEWHLDLDLRLKRDLGERYVRGSFRQGGAALTAEATRILAAQDLSNGEETQVTMTLPATALLCPVLDALTDDRG